MNQYVHREVYSLQSGWGAAVAMLMLLSLSMALVGAESGAGAEEEGCRGGARQDSLLQLASQVEEEAAAICRTGEWRGRGLWSPYPRYHCGERTGVNIRTIHFIKTPLNH